MQSEDQRTKREKITRYLDGIEDREDCILRLSGDHRFYTDPDGIDPVALLPDAFRKDLLGNFVEQGDAHPNEELESIRFKAEGEGERMEARRKRIEKYLDELPRRAPSPGEKQPRATLLYENGSISVNYAYPSRLDVDAFYDGEETYFTIANWSIWEDLSIKGCRFLGVDIAATHYGIDDPDEAKDEKSSKAWWADSASFLQDPFAYLERIYQGKNKKIVDKKEKKFIERRREAALRREIPEDRQYGSFVPFIPFVSDHQTIFVPRKKHRTIIEPLFPGQSSTVVQNRSIDYRYVAGSTIGILENAVIAAREHGYDGIIATPAYFHSAENFEKQGLRFEHQEAGDRMEMLKAALRSIDEVRYRHAMESALAAGRTHQEARKIAGDAVLTPQERSWIVLLNSVRNQDIIPPEFNLKNSLEKHLEGVVAHLHDQLKEFIAYLDSVREEGGTIEGAVTDAQVAYWLAALTTQSFEELVWQTENAYLDEGKGYERTIQKDRRLGFNPHMVAYQIKKLEGFLSALKNAPRLDFPANADTRMILGFERGSTTPEYVQRQLDVLIENGIVTGDTLMPRESYIKEYAEKKRAGPPYTVVYHMYNKNGLVKQKDGSIRERKNIEHLAEVRSAIESFGLRTRVENAQGNVRNPGPNRLFGWPTEEPSVWTDEIRGIEKSEQNALVISCRTLDDVQRVIEYLRTRGFKEDENETSTDPRWFVPDIRILGMTVGEYEKLDENAPLKKIMKPALLHVRRGERDGYASTITHETHRLATGFTHVPILIHGAMDAFIRKDEERLGEYEFVGR